MVDLVLELEDKVEADLLENLEGNLEELDPAAPTISTSPSTSSSTVSAPLVLERDPNLALRVSRSTPDALEDQLEDQVDSASGIQSSPRLENWRESSSAQSRSGSLDTAINSELVMVKAADFSALWGLKPTTVDSSSSSDL